MVYYLWNIKSFKYPRTNNYHKILAFIDDAGSSDEPLELNPPSFDVQIVGHSCGLSDKTLLRTIFESENCIGIKAFHYKEDKQEAIEEHFYKGIAISRHFKDKPSFREKFQTFDNQAKLIQRKVSKAKVVAS
jgi:hypothetical protein